MKGYVAIKNISFKCNGVKCLVEEAFDQVLAQKWYKCYLHVKIIEQKYWSTDINVENEIEKIIIQVVSSDSGTDTEDKLEICDEDTEKSTSRQRSGKGAIRKRLPLQKPRWEKTKLTIRYLYHENIS